MSMLAEPPDPASELADVLEVFATVLRAAPVREIEVVLAFLSLLVLRRVEAGRTSAAGADQLFTLIDVELTSAGRTTELSENATALLLEGHHFHHWGGEWGPDPAAIRRLGSAIIAAHG